MVIQTIEKPCNNEVNSEGNHPDGESPNGESSTRPPRNNNRRELESFFDEIQQTLRHEQRE